MSKKVKLTKIELETTDGKTVALTIDEAKELHGQLHELFGDKTVYVPGSPVVIDRWPRPYWMRGSTVYCGSNSASIKSDNLKVTYSCEAA